MMTEGQPMPGKLVEPVMYGVFLTILHILGFYQFCGPLHIQNKPDVLINQCQNAYLFLHRISPRGGQS